MVITASISVLDTLLLSFHGRGLSKEFLKIVYSLFGFFTVQKAFQSACEGEMLNLWILVGIFRHLKFRP